MLSTESNVVILPRPNRPMKGRSVRGQAGMPLAASEESLLTTKDRRTLYGPLKRGMDVIGSSALLLVGAPLLVGIALLVRGTSRGPVIFRQQRITDGGRIFTMYKFRTMVVDAEASTGAIWASDGDPRVTRVGRFLRHFRFDELPQLVNVLKGEMSLIGPRPERPEMVAMLKKNLPSFDRRHSVRAGITGLAQTATGYASCMNSYRRKLALDLLYVKNRCLLLDLRIALRTIIVVLTGSGSK